MKRFLTLFAFALAAMLTMPAYAGLSSDSVQSAGFSSLSEAQKAEVIKYVAEKSSGSDATAGTGKTTSAQVSEWVDIGTKIGQGLGGAAREVGVVANEFVKTPVGQWTMAIIVWKFMGGVIVHVIGGLAVWLVGLTFVLYLQRTTARITKEYGEPRTLLGFIPLGRPVTKYSRDVPRDGSGDVDSGFVAAWIFCYAVVLIVGLATIFSY